MAEPSIHELARISRWNRLIPACAKDVKVLDTSVRYLHPTKGYKYVSKKRLGVQS